MFNPQFYRFQNPNLCDLSDVSLEEHFNQVGWKEARDPNAFFNIQYYLDNNSDVAASQVNALKHYLQFGRTEGRVPYLSQWSGQTRDFLTKAHLDQCMNWIDSDVLRAANPALGNLDDDTVAAWFFMDGWRDGFDPSARFRTAFYLETYPDVATINVNPLLHYVLYGQREGRSPVPQPPSKPQFSHQSVVPPDLGDTTEQTARLDADLQAVRAEFDAEFYRATYLDVEGDNDMLLRHYMSVGWTESRNPSASFDTRYYINRYSDIAATGINPLLHYVLFGRDEGRRPIGEGPVQLRLDKSARLAHGLPRVTVDRFIGEPAQPPQSAQVDQLHIHWVVPDFQAGSGGHMTIFRMVRYLELSGHRNTIWIETPKFHDTGHAAWETIVKSFQCVEADVHFVSDALFETSSDVVIATGWDTAWTVNALSGFSARMYFVQDHEPEFYPTGAHSNLAMLSYGFDLGCICASPWLEQMMSKQYGRWARGFYLAYEAEQHFYKVRTNAASPARSLRIAVYGRAHTDRRCVQLALAALEILAQSRDDFEVHFFGQDDMPCSSAPFRAFNHGVLPPEKLNNLYNTCDVGMCFSGTNYSLVPQEMMASGLPLIELDTDSTRLIFPEDVVTLAGPAPGDIAAKLGLLLDRPDHRDRQRQAALSWVQQFSWRDSASGVETAIKDYLTQTGVSLAAPSAVRPRDTMLDVVIPTFNGKDEFARVLDALRQQRHASQMQIHCVDSSSTDGTIEWLKNQRDVSLTVIDRKEFQHGRTRNLGASLGTAPLIAFLTQDATPASPAWAIDICKMMARVPEAAGLFGRHIAYPEHPYFVRKEIETHFRNMLEYPLTLSKHTDPKRWDAHDIGWRQFLHFYSDNNSAMRRDVWTEIPYPEIDYGEDQVWARDIIEAGYSKIYAPSAAVYHSHDYTPEQTFARSRTEGAFFYEHFGYELGKGTESEIAARVAREQRDMQAWGQAHGIATSEIEMRKQNIAEKYRGWREGMTQSAFWRPGTDISVVLGKPLVVASRGSDVAMPRYKSSR